MDSSIIADAEGLAAVQAAPRAMAFLTVPWSAPERVARAVFISAATQLSSPMSPVRVPCFLIDEGAEPCLSWLASLGLPALGTYPRGAGSVLWLAGGRVESFVIDGQSLKPQDIVARVGALWNADDPGSATAEWRFRGGSVILDR
jgi:hypothetical protein